MADLRTRTRSIVSIQALGLMVFGTVGTTACVRQPVDAETTEDMWARERAAMVDVIKSYGVTNARVLSAMEKVRRHIYIPESYRRSGDAYGDHPCPIGYGQTMSQPFIVAYMTEKIALRNGEKVLEVGTGSGYQAAVLAEMGADIYTIEIVAALAEHARSVLSAEGYEDVRVLTGDGYRGWPEYAPFDVIIVTCAPEKVPETLVEQLREGGRMVLPVGKGDQRLVILRKRQGRVIRQADLAVRFVPMIHGDDQ